MKIIVDGEFDISDETGQKVHAVKGDVFYCEWGIFYTVCPLGVRIQECCGKELVGNWLMVGGHGDDWDDGVAELS